MFSSSSITTAQSDLPNCYQEDGGTPGIPSTTMISLTRKKFIPYDVKKKEV
jgi:hypothetical protein